jgi:hypothetical protein
MSNILGRRPTRAIPNANSQTLSRAIPHPPQPQGSQEAGNYNTDLRTFLTLAGQITQLVPAQRSWVKGTFILETAGPVEISTSSQWQFLNGQGMTLITDQPITVTLPRGTNLYVQSGSSNRVRYQVEPYPWLEQITGSVQQGFAKLAQALMALTGRGQ